MQTGLLRTRIAVQYKAHSIHPVTLPLLLIGHWHSPRMVPVAAAADGCHALETGRGRQGVTVILYHTGSGCQLAPY